MPKTLSQLRVDLSNRLGFSSQAGAGIIQAPMLDSILQDAQQDLIEQFGTQIGSTIPATRFTNPNDEASVPEYPLGIHARILARTHYKQDTKADEDQWQRWYSGVMGR